MNEMGEQSFAQIKASTPGSRDAEAIRIINCVANAIVERLPAEERSHGWEVWVFDGNKYDQVGLNAVAGRSKDSSPMEPVRFEDMRRGCFDPAARVADMARRSHMPIVGVIENMSGFACDHGDTYELFGAGGGAELAEDLNVPLMGNVPLNAAVVAGGASSVSGVGGEGGGTTTAAGAARSEAASPVWPAARLIRRALHSARVPPMLASSSAARGGEPEPWRPGWRFSSTWWWSDPGPPF